jgi:hypothetical protein
MAACMVYVSTALVVHVMAARIVMSVTNRVSPVQYVWVYVCMYIYMCVCVCVYIYIYRHTHRLVI